MKKLFLSLTFMGLLSFATPAKAETYIGCGTWIIWCNGHPAYYAIACTYEEIQIWQSLLCNQ